LRRPFPPDRKKRGKRGEKRGEFPLKKHLFSHACKKNPDIGALQTAAIVERDDFELKGISRKREADRTQMASLTRPRCLCKTRARRISGLECFEEKDRGHDSNGGGKLSRQKDDMKVNLALSPGESMVRRQFSRGKEREHWKGW